MKFQASKRPSVQTYLALGALLFGFVQLSGRGQVVSPGNPSTNLTVVATNTTGLIAGATNAAGSPVVFESAFTNYVGAWGLNNNTGSKVSPWATLSYAASNTPSGAAIELLPGINTNEIGIVSNYIKLPANIAVIFDAGAWLVLSNMSNRGINQGFRQAAFVFNQGDYIKNIHYRWIDTQQDSAWPVGWNASFSGFNLIPATNPCVFDGGLILSDSGGFHLEEPTITNAVNVFCYNLTILAQGHCLEIENVAGTQLFSGCSFNLTNYAPVQQASSKVKPYRGVGYYASSYGPGNLILDGCFIAHSDFNSNTNWPCCAVFNENNSTAGSTNVLGLILNGVTITPTCTNAGSFDVMTGFVSGANGQTNMDLFYGVYRSDGLPLTETNGASTVSALSPQSNVRSLQFPFAPVVIAAPNSTVNWTNTTANGTLCVSNAGVTFTAVKKNGITISTQGDSQFPVNRGDYVSETYSLGSPLFILSY